MTTTKEMEIAVGSGEKATKLKICNPSVCVGGAQPSSCVCPVTPKK